MANGKIPRCFKCFPIDRFTKPHKIICKYLEQRNIKFEVEKFIRPFSVDIFIEPNKIIEVYGDYWHSNPKFYKEDDVLKFPNNKNFLVEKIWQKDKNRIKYLQKYNDVLILWEDEINNNSKETNDKINIFLKEG